VSKKVPVVKITTPDAAGELAGVPLEATVAMADVAAAMREGLLAFSTSTGPLVMQQMLTEELASIIGPKHAKLGLERVGNWHGTTTGHVALGSRKVTVPRPRGRYVDRGEVELATSECFASEDLLREVVVERMLAGVATRRHVDVTERVGVEGKATSRSAVSAPVQGGHRGRTRRAAGPRPHWSGDGGVDDRRALCRRPDDRRRPDHHC
jgi:putative transposase